MGTLKFEIAEQNTWTQAVKMKNQGVPPDPNQCHRNEFTCAHGPSAPKASAKMIQSRIFCKFDVDWGLGDEDHHESSSKKP